MQSASAPKSHIVITDQFEEELQALQHAISPLRSVIYKEDELLVEHARAIIAEAYLAEKESKYLIIVAHTLSSIAQNVLLKLFEEPPQHIFFIIITSSKSALLPTVRSRLPVVHKTQANEQGTITLGLKALDLESMYQFVKAHERLKGLEAHQLLDDLMHHATVVESLLLTKKQCEAFELAFELVLKHARFQTVLLALLGTFLKRL